MEILKSTLIIGGTLILILLMGMHHIEEGHVGVYFRGGALLKGITEPGYNWKFPLVTRYENVQVTVQTDKVTNIPCGTSGGVVIYFDIIEVVNRLRKEQVWETIYNYTTDYDKTWIYDKIHHEINQFCSKHSLEDVYITKFDMLDENLMVAIQNDCDKWAPGIEIISIRITKPRIPKHIAENYEMMERAKTNYKIAIETQKVLETKAETLRLEATIKARMEADVSSIQMEKEINETRSAMEKQSLINKMRIDQESAKATATMLRLQAQAEANKKRLSPEFLQYEAIRLAENSTKLFFGPSIQEYISGSILNFNLSSGHQYFQF